MADAPVLGRRRRAPRRSSSTSGAFGARFAGPLVHQSVRAEQAARRRGTAATKTRGMVSGGGAKPWRQKGTGRARAGSSRSPIWTGGGTVFGPQPRSYTFKVNRKEQRAALRSALSLHAERGSIAILDASAFAAPKTSQALDLLEDWESATDDRPTLVVLVAEESAAALSFRNLERVAVLTAENVGVTDLARRRQRCSSPSRRSRRSPRAPARRAPARRRRPDGAHAGDHPPGRLGEELRALGGRPLHLPRAPDAHKTQIRQAVEALFDVHVVEVRTMSVKSKPKRRGSTPRAARASGRRRSCRCAPARPSRSSRAWRPSRARSRRCRSASQADEPGMRFVSYPDFAEITKSKPEKTLVEGLKKSGGRNVARAQDRPPPRRRRQARLPPDRLQAPQGRRAGEGRRDRVRPQPLRLHRAAALRRRREALHPRAAAADGRA